MTRPVLDPGVRRPRTDTLVGGTPMRSLRLSADGIEALDALLAGQPHPGAAALERRLIAASMLLRAAGASRRHDVTVVIPARATPAEVARSLDGVPVGVDVVVVDDASATPLTDALLPRDGVVVHRAATRSGAAASRNAGAAMTSTQLLAFVDADVELAPGWLDRLSGHFAHDDVVAVAPRVVSRPASGLADVLERELCALDLGPASGVVQHGAPVSYLPSTVLLVRRSAFDAVGGFDPALDIGEDVDLVWRLQSQGTVRYDADVIVRHGPRTGVRAALRRRWDYGSSAGPLDRRHPGRLRHLVLSVWSALPWGAAVIHPALGVATAGLLVGLAPRGMAALPPGQARRLAARGQWAGALALARYAVRPMLPVTVAAAVSSRRVRRLLPVVAAAYLAATSDDLLRAPLHRLPARLALRLADDVAYSGGVWSSCRQQRRLGPLLPRLIR
jgi:mycofactocin system glycosyltransferase